MVVGRIEFGVRSKSHAAAHVEYFPNFPAMSQFDFCLEYWDEALCRILLQALIP